VALAAACTGEEAKPRAIFTPPPGPTATPVTSLREVDFADRVFAAELVAPVQGGEVSRERVRFADLIGNDGVEEAVVIVESGGTAGEIGADVCRLREGRPQLIHFFRDAGRPELLRDAIPIREGVYSMGDAECCPSRLRETNYQWRGESFVLLSEQVVPNPAR